MATAQTNLARPAAREASPSLIGMVIAAVFWLFLSLLFSIAIEWVGLTFWWPEQGAQHAISMYERELTYFSGDLDRSILVADTGDAPMLLSGGFR